MDQTIGLDAKKRESSFCEEKIYPMRRGERNNVVLTVQVRADGAPYDLTGKEARRRTTTRSIRRRSRATTRCPRDRA